MVFKNSLTQWGGFLCHHWGLQRLEKYYKISGFSHRLKCSSCCSQPMFIILIVLTVEIDMLFCNFDNGDTMSPKRYTFSNHISFTNCYVKPGTNSTYFKVLYMLKGITQKKSNNSASKNVTTISNQVAQHFLENDITWCANSWATTTATHCLLLCDDLLGSYRIEVKRNVIRPQFSIAPVGKSGTAMKSAYNIITVRSKV